MLLANADEKREFFSTSKLKKIVSKQLEHLAATQTRAESTAKLKPGKFRRYRRSGETADAHLQSDYGTTCFHCIKFVVKFPNSRKVIRETSSQISDSPDQNHVRPLFQSRPVERSSVFSGTSERREASSSPRQAKRRRPLSSAANP